jgi:mannitol/fructose-specific phosphotransferase system IIA component (Ntr-type)
MNAHIGSRSDQASTLADFTSPGLLVPQLDARDATGVISELCLAMAREGRVPDRLGLLQAVLKRESLSSSQMEAGMAFPHARLPGPGELAFALGRSAEPLVWHTGGTPAVQLVFLLAVPADDAAGHLRLISGLSRLSRDARALAQLRSARDPAQMFETLRQAPLAPATGRLNSPQRTLA